MNAKKEKNKAAVLVTVLCLIGAGALAGIFFIMHRDAPVEVAEPLSTVSAMVPESASTSEPESAPESAPASEPAPTPESAPASESAPAPEAASASESAAELEPALISEPAAELEPIPADGIKEDKSAEDSAAEGSEEEQDSQENSANEEAETQPALATQPDATPRQGQIEGDKIYILGFGWVDYNGGGAKGTYVDGMVENGNKVGIMD